MIDAHGVCIIIVFMVKIKKRIIRKKDTAVMVVRHAYTDVLCGNIGSSGSKTVSRSTTLIYIKNRKPVFGFICNNIKWL